MYSDNDSFKKHLSSYFRDSLNYTMYRFIVTCKYYVIIKNYVSLYLEIPVDTIKKK